MSENLTPKRPETPESTSCGTAVSTGPSVPTSCDIVMAMPEPDASICCNTTVSEPDVSTVPEPSASASCAAAESLPENASQDAPASAQTKKTSAAAGRKIRSERPKNRSQYAPFRDCPEPIRDFLSYQLTIRNLSPRTVDGYYIELRTFFRFLWQLRNGVPDAQTLSEVSIQGIPTDMICSIRLSDIYEFLNFSYEQLGNQANARARKVSALSTFYQYLNVKTTLLSENPIKNLDRPLTKRALPKYLTLEESNQLLTATDRSEDPEHLRNYCMLTLFLNCGMRLSELVGINRADVRDDNTLRLLGKGNKERIVYLNEACVASIESYLHDYFERDKEIRRQDDALFISARTGRRLSARRIEQIIDECLNTAGLGQMGYTPHKLRHTAATLMYQYGEVDVRILKEILGHENLGTTEIYTHISNRQMESAASRSPLSSVRSESHSDLPGDLEEPDD